MKTITKTSTLKNIQWSDDSIFSETISGYKKTGVTLNEICNELYYDLFPVWARESNQNFEPDYTLNELIKHLQTKWNLEA